MKNLPALRARVGASCLCLLLMVALGATAQPRASGPAVGRLYDPANLTGERVAPADLADNLPIDHGAPALQQLLRKLRTRASFLLIVAHPDDEDGGLLTYLSRGQGARVAMLTLNRGEGGQNLMSADFEDALGLIRTQELLSADRYMAVDQFFGSVVDFGFSKTKEETLQKWTHDRVLYDAVRVVRLYRPLVIASVFIGGPTDGHGNHQVAGEIAQEVFSAAGDPKVFPDQIAAGLLPWTPLKVYGRAPFGRIDEHGIFDSATNEYAPAQFHNYATGKTTTKQPKANVAIPEGTPDPLLGGLSPLQFAREGLALQKSQIGGNFRPALPGQHDVYYHRFGSHLGQPDGDDSGEEKSLFEGIDTSFAGMATLVPDAPAKFRSFLEAIDHQLANAQAKFDPAKPGLIAPQLHEALAALDGFLHELEDGSVNDLPPSESFNLLHELRIKRVQLNDALLLARGLTLTATLADPAPGRPLLTTDHHVAVAATLTNAGAEAIDFAGIRLQTPTDPLHPAHYPLAQMHVAVAAGASRTDAITADPPTGLPATRPYFSRPDIEQPFYTIAEPALRNAPQTPAPLTALVTLEDHGVQLEIAATVAYPAPPAGSAQFNAPVARQAVVVVPPVSIQLASSGGILPIQEKSLKLPYVVRAANAEAHLQFRLSLPSGWTSTATPSVAAPTPGMPGDGKVLQEAATIVPARPAANATYPITVETDLGGKAYREGYRTVGYPGLTSTNYYTPSTYRANAVDVHTAPGLNVAYLPGTGDDVPSGLEELGIHVHLLTVADLTTAALKPYDVVLLGVRAYAAHPELAGAGSQPLIEYARNGGVVILQYNNARYGAAEAPFPITTPGSTGDHAHDVVDEAQPVAVLEQEAPLLNWPNHITSADFDHWVAERGHGFAATWDVRYQALLETHDPGQAPQKGALLVAPVGKGAYIYCGLALYRQLPEGVPGAFRLMANLVSYGKNPAFRSAAPSAK